MKHSITSGIITMAIVLLFGAVEGHSQTGKGLVADIPFDFYVKGELMMAGKYEFVNATTAYSPAPLIVRPASGSNMKAVVPIGTIEEAGKYGSQPVIIFRQYGPEYFLAAVHNTTANVRLRIIPEKRERELRKANREAKYVSIKPARV